MKWLETEDGDLINLERVDRMTIEESLTTGFYRVIAESESAIDYLFTGESFEDAHSYLESIADEIVNG